MTPSIAAIRRSGFVVFACMALALLSTQVQAQTCTGTPQVSIDPVSQTVPESIPGVPTTVQLQGVTNKTGAIFLWEQTSGPPVALSPNRNVANPTFTAPSSGPTVLRFQLTVSCSTGNPKSVTTDINVTDVVTNAPPTAAATASPASAFEGNVVTLDGTGSSDPEGSALTYSWVQTGGIPSVTLSNANPTGSIVTFVAPNTPITTGAVLTFRLTVRDTSLLSGTADKSVNISWANDQPLASLVCPGGMFVVDERGPVTLNGSGSSDSDGSIVSYAWSQDVGLPNLGVAALTTPSISFNAPNLGYNQLGGVTVRLTVTDNNGAVNSTGCSVWINDVTAPTIRVPADQTVEADFAGGKAVSYQVLAQDAVENQLPYTLPCTPPSGNDFPLAAAPTKQRTTAVACSAADSAGNAANAGFNVTVQDTTAPVITVPGSFAVQATGPSGAVANYTATTADAVDGAGTANCVPAPGNFALGTTSVACNATDARGNAATQQSFNLTVHDTTAPVIAARANVGPVEATSSGGAAVNYTSPATSDLVDGAGTASCAPASDSTFALGETTVYCAAVDHARNRAVPTSFTVTVRDTTPPVIAARANVDPVEATSSAGAAVSYTSPATSDLVDGAGTASCAPTSGGTFALGVHTVTCNATDAAGNRARATTFQVTVEDNTAPAIAPHADVNATAPANSSAVVTYGLPTAVDIVDGPVAVTCAPAAGSTFNVGATRVVCSATDQARNTATSSFTVNVSYSFTGFFRPIDNLPVANVVKAGSAIPVKFNLGGNQGLNIFAAGFPTSVGAACGATQTDAIEETVTAGGSSLSYDPGNNQYIYVWKTDKSWSGCRQLQVKLRDGSSRWASFSFTR